MIENFQEEHIRACYSHLHVWEQNLADGKPFREQDRLFHVTLCQAIGNKLLVELENIFWIAYSNAVNKTFVDIDEAAYQITLNNHYKILAAVEERNVELAQQLMADHFQGIKERIGTTIGGEEK
ncbi:hypothetical protein CSA56_05755 [candidate division KSB3 bacterium]|uniref:GntR C-terminal domain-containing protein n=1 Tax=candidate division KSB3 bacterium TaxID=2044937 RepID=A0A2G6KH85_9BACT|nr:MAG: hypothetical protein CSA56_05755 [candidate division KSB3 bacterium]